MWAATSTTSTTIAAAAAVLRVLHAPHTHTHTLCTYCVCTCTYVEPEMRDRELTLHCGAAIAVVGATLIPDPGGSHSSRSRPRFPLRPTLRYPGTVVRYCAPYSSVELDNGSRIGILSWASAEPFRPSRRRIPPIGQIPIGEIATAGGEVAD